MRCDFRAGLTLRVRCVCAMNLLLVAPLSAQDSDLLRVGARVSVSVREPTCGQRFRRCRERAWVGGTLVGVTADTLVVQLGPATTVAVPRERGQSILISAGHSRARTGVQAALLAGYLTYALSSVTDATRGSVVRWSATMAGSALVLGTLRPSERWRRVAEP